MVSPSLLQTLGELSREDQAQALDYLQGEVAGDDDLSDAVRALLDDRLAALEDDPATGRGWEDVEADLRRRFL
ncbi:MAG: addiction module protein [Propionibacteriaceae bacterium]|nr:addiction module protein [Propionibacteriaceae bacterium]